jgi:hypothetical protein|tara:strand:- start:69 stop:284 length:216 start_codon:yes stop_codon:yes gene_type:complete
MIIQKPKAQGIIIDLTGPDGNAFSLLAAASSLCKQLGYHAEPVLDDMKSGDYENLLEVFDKHFGDFVTLYR